jgi:hypothetical protein
MIECVRFPTLVPYYAQIATPSLALKIFQDGYDPVNDPNWRIFGAQSAQEYSYWVMRACGIVCVKMCVEAFARTQRTVHDWIRMGLDRKGYLIQEEAGQRVERGWIHHTLAELMSSEGLYSRAVPAALEEIIDNLRKGRLFIASVSYELGTLNPITFKGGHLVVLRGMDLKDGFPVTVYLNNPSGRYSDLQENAAVSGERFEAAYTGRGIVVGSTPLL